MREVELSEFWKFPNSQTKWPIGNTFITLSNQFAVVLFDNIKTKKRLYANWLKNLTDRSTKEETCVLEENEELEPSDFIVIECGVAALHRMVDVPSNFQVVNCTDSNLLIPILEKIMNGPSKEIGDCRLNTLIVENVSSFYWEKRCMDRKTRVKWYWNLNRTLVQLKDRYRCNVVVTAWNLEFERGYKARQGEAPSFQQTFSFTPLELFHDCHYAIGYSGNDAFQYLSGSWQLIQI